MICCQVCRCLHEHVEEVKGDLDFGQPWVPWPMYLEEAGRNHRKLVPVLPTETRRHPAGCYCSSSSGSGQGQAGKLQTCLAHGGMTIP